MQISDKIGRYKILRKLGEGGMGEVYLAHDESLDREVAIKVLLPEFTSNLERVNRFKLEARAASSLNHPSIITIYEICEEDGKIFIVTEFIEGETIRNLIERNALELNSTLNCVQQIASALTSAHKAGIIHRDIKPENIMIREDGIIKVLDFGLAKPTTVESEAETRELVTTKAGVVLGSLSYMSPEQARGKEVDARTDIWSIGVCLYEMLSGKAPFAGETMTDILANIIHKEPEPITDLMADAPLELHRIIKKSLRKDREERYQTAKDFAIDLKNLMREMDFNYEHDISISPDSSPKFTVKNRDILTDKTKIIATDEVSKTLMLTEEKNSSNKSAFESAHHKQKTSMVLYLAFGLLFLVGLTWISYKFFQTNLSASFINSAIQKMPINGNINGLEFSPDGKYLAIVEGSQGSKMRLILRQFETNSEKEIVPFEDSQIALIGFSPDGNYIYFRKSQPFGLGANLYRLPLLGGEPQQVAFDVDSGVSFTPDGKQIIFHRHTMSPSKEDFILKNADGSGEEKIVYTTTDAVSHPQISPDGSTIVFAHMDKTKGFGQDSARLAWIPMSGGNQNFIGDYYFSQIADFRWLKDGSGLISSATLANESNYQIVSIAFPNGEITRVTKDSNDYYGNSITADGKRIAAVQWNTVTGIWEYDLQTKAARQIVSNSQEYKGFSGLLATFDNKLIYTKIDGKDNVDLWQMNVDGSDNKVFLTGKGINRARLITSDNKTIIIESTRNGSQEIWKVDSDGKNEVQLTKAPNTMKTVCGIMPDNKTLIYRNQTLDNSKITIESLNIETGETKTIWQDDKFYLQNSSLSPDGKYLLMPLAPVNFETGNIPQTSLSLAAFDGIKLSEPKLIKQKITGSQHQFTADGKSLYFIENSGDNSDISKFEIETGKITKVTNFNLESIFRYVISKNGKKLYLVRGTVTKEAVLIKNQ